MADWLTRSPEEHIQYDVDVLFGPWPSHPTDMDLPTLKAHLSHHHIQNALAISTRGALFSDQAGNTETLAATDWPSGSSPSATSPPDQMRGSIAVSPRPGGPPSSSPSATSPADEIGRPGGAAGSAAGQGRRAVGSGSSPSATSRPDQVREALGGSGRVGDLPGSSPSATLSAGVGGGSGGGAGAGGGQGGGVQGVDPGTGLGVRLIPVGTVDLRDAVSAAEQLDGLVESGVRFLRLFTGAQGVQGETPAYRHVVGEAIGRGLVVLQDGDPRKFGAVLAGRGAEVIFLDLHVYLLADFILMAKQEAGFKATTRMLSSPDGIERVVDSVGAGHLVFGSRTPFMDVSPQTLRLRYARISAEDRALIAGGNIQELVG